MSHTRHSLFLASLMVLCASAAYGGSRLVRDLATDPGSPSSGSGPLGLTSNDKRVFFTAFEPSSGRSMWASDGTTEGTFLLRGECDDELCDGVFSLGFVGDRFLWVGNHEELRASDGTPEGTLTLSEEGIATDQYQPSYRTAHLPGQLLFGSCSGFDCTLSRTDGTPGGTRRISPQVEGLPQWLVARGASAFFTVSTAAAGTSLWSSNGTATGTRKVADLPGYAFHLAALPGRIVFVMQGPEGDELWSIDGTSAGPTRLTNFPHQSPFSSYPYEGLKVVGDAVFFVADDVVHGTELWRSDGTVSGTRRISDFGYADALSRTGLGQVETIAGRVVFVASDGLSPTSLWVAIPGTGGNPGSPQRLFEGFQGGLYKAGGAIYFETSTHELWRTDGTPPGTKRLEPLCDPACSGGKALQVLGDELLASRAASEIVSYDVTGARRVVVKFPTFHWAPMLDAAKIGSTYYFSADGPEGVELWRGGVGTPPTLVADINRNASSGDPQYLQPLGSGLFFAACGGGLGFWRSSGTEQTTVQLAAGHPWERCDFISVGTPLVVAGAYGYFIQHPASNEQELWRTDGTAAGTARVLGNEPNQSFGSLAAFNGQLWFTRTIDGAVELWRSDGTSTSAAARLPDDVLFLTRLHAVGGELYFWTVDPSGTISRLWRSDGTQAGTRVVSVDEPHRPSAPEQFVRFGGNVYFTGTDGQRIDYLWRTDGTTTGTMRVADLRTSHTWSAEITATPVGVFLFAATAENTGLHVTDGSSTTLLAPVVDFHEGRPRGLTAFGNGVVFSHSDAAHGRELWISDGTPAGTHLLADVQPGPQSSWPAELAVVDGRLFFSARDKGNGRELWTSDGTAAGTRLVQDIAPGARSSSPEHLMGAGGRLYFSADNGRDGRELWALDLAEPLPPYAEWISSPALPGYRLQARIADPQGSRPATLEATCIDETLCLSGALPGRSELFVRVVGPKPNGRLWPTLVKFNTSQVEVWLQHTSSGELAYYELPGSPPGVDVLPGLADRNGFRPSAPGVANVTVGPPPMEAAGEGWTTLPQFPGFRFRVQIFDGSGVPRSTRLEPSCIEETGCWSGAVPGRSELFLRMVGPKPNGYVWPTIVRFTTAKVEVTIQQVSTGLTEQYRLTAIDPSSDRLDGLFDREGFRP